MALQTRITNTVASAMCDAMVDLCDAGGAGSVKIYDGTQPANPDTAVTTQNILAEMTLNATAFGAASNGVATAAGTPLTDSSANNTGTASWFRVFNNAGTALWDGSAGEAADTTDMTLDNKSINSGQSVSITAWTVTMPKTEA